MKITGRAKELYDLLYTKQFDFAKLKAALETGMFSAEDVSFAGYMYIDNCIANLMDKDFVYHYAGIGEVVPGYESSHVYDAIKLLLDYGLDPNAIYTEEHGTTSEQFNIMWELRYVDNGYQAADTLALLLERGGDPNLTVDGCNFNREINHDVWFETVNYEDGREVPYDSLVHYWMVLLAYGAHLEDGKLSVDLVKGFDIKALRNHREYYYGVVKPVNGEKDWSLCIFQRGHRCEVARF